MAKQRVGSYQDSELTLFLTSRVKSQGSHRHLTQHSQGPVLLILPRGPCANMKSH